VRPSEKQGSEGFLWHGLARYLTLREVCVCFWHKADVQTALMNVRFERNNGHDADVTRCLLMTRHSGG
jgi:hypothetical protein